MPVTIVGGCWTRLLVRSRLLIPPASRPHRRVSDACAPSGSNPVSRTASDRTSDEPVANPALERRTTHHQWHYARTSWRSGSRSSPSLHSWHVAHRPPSRHLQLAGRCLVAVRRNQPVVPPLRAKSSAFSNLDRRLPTSLCLPSLSRTNSPPPIAALGAAKASYFPAFGAIFNRQTTAQHPATTRATHRAF